jgi:hypothetical protein
MTRWISALAILLAACSGDAARSPTCGMALIIGPTMIRERLFNNARAIITDAPRGLPEILPGMVIQQKQAQMRVAYDAEGRIVLRYEGPGFPASGAGYGLLVVDDTSERAMGVLIYESEEPRLIPKLGTVTAGAGGSALNLYGVRVDWASVSNPRCPLLGAPPPPPLPPPSSAPAS